MALLDVLIPQLINFANDNNLSERMADTDMNHWNYQIQSFINDVNGLSKKNNGKQEEEFCKPGTSTQNNSNQTNFNGDCNQWKQFLSQALGINQNQSKSTNNDSNQTNTTENKFTIKVNVDNFSPQDITVKTNGNNVIVIGKHDEKRDKFGFVSREFTRRYELPDDVNPESITSYFANGILTIEADKNVNERSKVIPILVEVNHSNNEIKEKTLDNQDLD